MPLVAPVALLVPSVLLQEQAYAYYVLPVAIQIREPLRAQLVLPAAILILLAAPLAKPVLVIHFLATMNPSPACLARQEQVPMQIERRVINERYSNELNYIISIIIAYLLNK